MLSPKAFQGPCFSHYKGPISNSKLNFLVALMARMGYLATIAKEKNTRNLYLLNQRVCKMVLFAGDYLSLKLTYLT